MRTVGFFRDLEPSGPSVYRGSIRDHLAAVPLPDEDQVVAYLRSGHALIDTMGATRDVIGGEEYVLGGASIVSDGEWLWREDLSYYVATYHLRLPDAFIESVRKNNYRVPEPDEELLASACDEAERLLGYHQPPAP